MSIKEVREQGIGSNFTVLNPVDGYRKDNHLWFGTCSVCGESVVNSRLDGIWQHTIIKETKYHESGQIRSQVSSQSEFCPSVSE
jgi:hypothetical protein